MEEMIKELNRELESTLRRYPIEVVNAWRDSLIKPKSEESI